MILQCQNLQCNVKVSVHDALFKSKGFRCFCPRCKEPIDTHFTNRKNQNKKAFLLISSLVHNKTYKYYLSEGENIFGRKSDTLVNVPNYHALEVIDKFMSRLHFSITVDNSLLTASYVIKDLAVDKNKTFIRKSIIGNIDFFKVVDNNIKEILDNGDVLKAGNTQLKFYITN